MTKKTVITRTLKREGRQANRALLSTLAALMLFCSCGAGSAAREVKLAQEKRNQVRPVPISSVAPEPVTIDSVNRRWSGARCQIRTAIEIKKDRDGAGWSKSDWLKAPVLPGEKEIKIRLLVSNRETLVREGHLRRNKELRPGAAFIATGWRFADPKKNKGIVIDLRFESVQVDARMEFKGPERLEDLEDVEQLTRIELFQLHEGSQQAAGTEQRMSSRQSPSVTPKEPTVTIVSAVVHPAVVSRGSEVELLITYTVGGVDSNGVQVNEMRELRRGETGIGTFNDTKTRQSGTYTSSHKIQVTRGTSPGPYTFRAIVSMGGKTGEARSNFEVR